MTSELVQTRAPVAARPTGRWDRVAAWSLLIALVVVFVAAFVLGERETEVSDLRRAIGSGEVSEVRLSAPLPEGARGYQPVTIRWEEHGLGHVTTVTQASDERQARKVQRPRHEVVVGDVAEALTTNGRAVTVTGRTSEYYGGSGLYTDVFGVTAPGWLGLTWLAMVCGALFLAGSLEPWRATRWAWAWLILMTPVGIPLFLLFGGPTGLLPPRVGAYRLTGGWAFLLALVLFPAAT